MKRLTLVALIVCSTGCADTAAKTAAARSAPAQPGVRAAAPAVAAVAAPSVGQVRRVDPDHYARFVDDELDSCTDLEDVWDLSSAVLSRWHPQDRSAAELSDGSLRIRRPCAEQFASKSHLASCTLRIVQPTRPAKTGGTIGTVSNYLIRYYRFATAFADQSNMRDCIRRGGDWRAIADTSLEYDVAESEYNLKQMQRRHR